MPGPAKPPYRTPWPQPSTGRSSASRGARPWDPRGTVIGSPLLVMLWPWRMLWRVPPGAHSRPRRAPLCRASPRPAPLLLWTVSVTYLSLSLSPHFRLPQEQSCTKRWDKPPEVAPAPWVDCSRSLVLSPTDFEAFYSDIQEAEVAGGRRPGDSAPSRLLYPICPSPPPQVHPLPLSHPAVHSPRWPQPYGDILAPVVSQEHPTAPPLHSHF